MLRVFSLLLVVSLAFAQTPDPRCNVDRPRPIHVPHETDCGLYYLCHLGVPILMPRCPAGKLFDTISSQCRPEADAFCGPAPTQPTTLTTIPSTIPAETTLFPTEAPTTPVEVTLPPSEAPTAPIIVPTLPVLVPTVPTS